MAAPQSISALLAAATAMLKTAGVENPRAESRLLLEHATGIDRLAQIKEPDRLIGPELLNAFQDILHRRASREPMAYILGSREFYGRSFTVTPAVLIPRPESELIVERGLEILASSTSPRILDIATGSGCLLVTFLASIPSAVGQATDLSEEALAIATANAQEHGVSARAHFQQTSWAQGLDGPFDLIISNPPYIASADLAALQPEVTAFEPHLALDGGPSGLNAYKAMTPDLLRLKGRTAPILLEIGRDQEGMLTDWFQHHGLRVQTHVDHAGIVRVLELT